MFRQAIRAETFDPKKAWSLLKAQKKEQAQSGETYAANQKQHGVHYQTLRMQFNNGKLNANVHMGRAIKTPETSNPSAFLSAKLQPEHRQKPDNDLQANSTPHTSSPSPNLLSLSLCVHVPNRIQLFANFTVTSSKTQIPNLRRFETLNCLCNFLLVDDFVELQMARERGVLLEKADEVTRSRMCLEGVHNHGDDNDEKEEQLQTSVKYSLFRKERCEKRKIREEYVNLCKIADDPAAVPDASTIRAPLLAPRFDF